MSVDELEIRLLGDLQFMHRGKVLPLPASRKTRALLGYLVATGKAHRREQLCELLWQEPDDPRGALRWSLSKIRPLLDAAAAKRLKADREWVAFDPCGNQVDLTALRALLAGGVENTPTDALTSAVGLIRGQFLEGLDLFNCYRFHDWCAADPATHARQVANTARCLAELELDMKRCRALTREAEALSASQNVSDLPWAQALLKRWDGDLNTAAEDMARVIVEREFDKLFMPADLEVVGRRMEPCLKLYGVRWLRSFPSADRLRMICEYEAADAESVRSVQREAQAQFVKVWTAEVINSG